MEGDPLRLGRRIPLKDAIGLERRRNGMAAAALANHAHLGGETLSV